MLVTTVHEKIRQFLGANGDWLSSVALSAIGPVDAAWLDERDSVFKDRYGIYFFLSRTGEVLYVGKAFHSTLQQRVWSHVRTPSLARKSSPDRKGLTLYPNHRWKDATSVEQAARSVVLQGDFDIAGFSIRSEGICALFEGVALAHAWIENKKLPPLNAVF